MSERPTVPPSSISHVDHQLVALGDAAPRWQRLPPNTKAVILRECLQTTAEVAEEWAEVGCAVKGYALGSPGHGEEFLGGVLPVMRNLRLFAEALEADGKPGIPRTWQRADGQWVAQVFPVTLLDKVLFSGVKCEVWIEPGELPTQGTRIQKPPAAGVALVLGAGNQSSIPAMDVLYKLVIDSQVCILKLNPVNEAIGPILERAFAPLIQRGFLAICYGGIPIGAHLTDHPMVDSIHITGSDRAYDAICWGTGAEGGARKQARTPRISKPITSELGCVSPVLIVPGQWSGAQLDYHARQIASMLTYNCGFNCNGARVLVFASGWSQKQQLLDLIYDKLAGTDTRYAYYPTAKATWELFTSKYPQHRTLGAVRDEGALPWTVLEEVGTGPDEFALRNEPWCGLFSVVELEASTPAEYWDQAVPFANARCWGTLSINVLIHPDTEAALEPAFDEGIAALRYGGVAINCWSGLNYGLVNATWGAYPGHPLHDIESGRGVVHNGLLIDHPQRSVVRAPFVMRPTPAWFTDHRNNLELGRKMVAFEYSPSWLKVPGVAIAGIKG